MSILFIGTLVAVLILDAALFATYVLGTVQIWPPPGQRTWEYRLTWTLFSVAFVGFLVVGGFDAGSLGFTRRLGEAGTLILGGTLVIGGTALASYAMGYLGRRAALGLKDELVTGGPFAVSRNPGYVGDLILMGGYVILTDSRLAGIVAILGAVWFLLAPFTEEPWLEEHYGEAYRRYKEGPPRFVGWTSVRRGISNAD